MSTVGALVGRAAAILTNGVVYGADLDLQNAINQEGTVDFTFTLGSLTNCILRFYAGPSAAPTDPLYLDGVIQEYTLTASTEGCFAFRCPGSRYFRASVEGTGTVTDSSVAFVYRYNDSLADVATDGQRRID